MARESRRPFLFVAILILIAGYAEADDLVRVMLTFHETEHCRIDTDCIVSVDPEMTAEAVVYWISTINGPADLVTPGGDTRRLSYPGSTLVHARPGDELHIRKRGQERRIGIVAGVTAYPAEVVSLPFKETNQIESHPLQDEVRRLALVADGVPGSQVTATFGSDGFRTYLMGCMPDGTVVERRNTTPSEVTTFLDRHGRTPLVLVGYPATRNGPEPQGGYSFDLEITDPVPERTLAPLDRVPTHRAPRDLGPPISGPTYLRLTNSAGIMVGDVSSGVQAFWFDPGELGMAGITLEVTEDRGRNGEAWYFVFDGTGRQIAAGHVTPGDPTGPTNVHITMPEPHLVMVATNPGSVELDQFGRLIGPGEPGSGDIRFRLAVQLGEYRPGLVKEEVLPWDSSQTDFTEMLKVPRDGELTFSGRAGWSYVAYGLYTRRGDTISVEAIAGDDVDGTVDDLRLYVFDRNERLLAADVLATNGPVAHIDSVRIEDDLCVICLTTSPILPVFDNFGRLVYFPSGPGNPVDFNLRVELSDPR